MNKKYSITIVDTFFETNNPTKFWQFVKDEMKLRSILEPTQFVADTDPAVKTIKIDEGQYYRCIRATDENILRETLTKFTELNAEQIELFIRNEGFASFGPVTLDKIKGGVLIDINFSSKIIEPAISCTKPSVSTLEPGKFGTYTNEEIIAEMNLSHYKM